MAQVTQAEVAGGVLEFWVVLRVFSLGGHTISYPSGCYGHGAFELCLPSLPNLHQILQLRNCIRSRSQSVTWSWGERRRPPDRVTLDFVGV